MLLLLLLLWVNGAGLELISAHCILNMNISVYSLQSGKGQEKKKRTQPAAPKATATCCCCCSCILILSPQQLNIIRGKKGSRPLEREWKRRENSWPWQ